MGTDLRSTNSAPQGAKCRPGFPAHHGQTCLKKGRIANPRHRVAPAVRHTSVRRSVP